MFARAKQEETCQFSQDTFMRWGEFRRRLRTDLDRFNSIHGSSLPLTLWRRSSLLLRPEIACIALYRLSHLAYEKKWFRLATFLYRFNLTLSGAAIHPRSQIGDACLIVHTIGLVVDARIGNRAILFGGSIIQPNFNGERWEGPPAIGDDCTIGLQATILGNASIGNRVVVAPFSLITQPIMEEDCTISWPANAQPVFFHRPDTKGHEI